MQGVLQLGALDLSSQSLAIQHSTLQLSSSSSNSSGGSVPVLHVAPASTTAAERCALHAALTRLTRLTSKHLA